MSHTIHGRIDPATGVYTAYERPVETPVRPVDPETAREEAQHLGAALAQGLRVLEARADNPTDDLGGRVRYVCGDTRTCAGVTVAGALNSPGWPPEWPPSKAARSQDERDLAAYVDELGLDKAGYDELCEEARRMMEDSRVADVVSVAEEVMARGVVLDESRIAMIRDALAPRSAGGKASGDVRHKSFGLAKASSSGPTGEFQALVSVFGNVDGVGDRIVKGAFTKTLESWRRSGDPSPVIHSHDWQNPDAHIGVADPYDVVETDRGLLVRGHLDIGDNDIARRVHKLMARRSLKEFSFGYKVPPGGQRRAKDGANELIELELIEVGPCLKGMNPATELHSVKGLDSSDFAPDAFDPEYEAVRSRERDRMYALLTSPAETDTAKASRRRSSLYERELRRECDRLQLEAALGFDQDLIDKLDL